MSDHDVVAQAARALREAADGSHAHASRTRTRILERALHDRRRRRRIALVVMPLAAAFLASAAWGAVTGRLSGWLDVVTRHTAAPYTADGPSPQSTKAVNATGPAPSSIASAPPPTPDEPGGTTAPPAGSAVSATATPSAPRIASAAIPAASSSSSREQSLYARAHRAHFVDHDPTAALRGWDAYLATYPNGRFALEARYNRAMTLVRLGRRDEARAALGPFARGDEGGYRQREARELLDVLAAADAGALTP